MSSSTPIFISSGVSKGTPKFKPKRGGLAAGGASRPPPPPLGPGPSLLATPPPSQALSVSVSDRLTSTSSESEILGESRTEGGGTPHQNTLDGSNEHRTPSPILADPVPVDDAVRTSADLAGSLPNALDGTGTRDAESDRQSTLAVSTEDTDTTVGPAAPQRTLSRPKLKPILTVTRPLPDSTTAEIVDADSAASLEKRSLVVDWDLPRPPKRVRVGSPAPSNHSYDDEANSPLLGTAPPRLLSAPRLLNTKSGTFAPSSTFEEDEEKSLSTSWLPSLDPPSIETSDQRATNSSSDPPNLDEMEGDFNDNLRKLSLRNLIRLNSKRLREAPSVLEDRRRQEREGSEAASERGEASQVPARSKSPSPSQAAVAKAPQPLQIVNGQLQLDESSLFVETEIRRGGEMEVVDESASKQRITSASFRKNQHYGKKWNAADTSKFLKAVQYFGSDFTILSPLFPNLTRRHLKSKFSLEDRKNPGRVSYSVSRPVPPPPEVREELLKNLAEIIEKRKSAAQETAAATIHASVEKSLEEEPVSSEAEQPDSAARHRANPPASPKVATSEPATNTPSGSLAPTLPIIPVNFSRLRPTAARTGPKPRLASTQASIGSPNSEPPSLRPTSPIAGDVRPHSSNSPRSSGRHHDEPGKVPPSVPTSSSLLSPGGKLPVAPPWKPKFKPTIRPKVGSPSSPKPSSAGVGLEPP